MKFPKMIPALADLAQDIAGPLPVDLLHEWVAGTRDVDKATAVLRPFEVVGTVVATDTSGLSLLTKERDLLDVVALVSRPKEIVHALGRDVGGRAIGTWVADNTEMFYGPEVPPETVVGAMLEAHAQVDAERTVRIGMCAHRGRFFEIGGGIYGPDADVVEYAAERFAAAGELLLTGEVAADLADRNEVVVARRSELDVVHPAGLFKVTAGPRHSRVPSDGFDYPHAFNEEVFQLLPQLRTDASLDLRARVYESLLQDRAIVFVCRVREGRSDLGVTGLLDTLVGDVALEAVLRQLPGTAQHLASIGGGLAILSFTDVAEAFERSCAIRDACVEWGLPVKVGIDAGPVLYFGTQGGASGISGDAVNIASKISEDVGVENMVSITTRAAGRIGGLRGGVPFTVRVSRVEIDGERH